MSVLKNLTALLLVAAAPLLAQTAPPQWTYSTVGSTPVAAYEGNVLVKGSVNSTSSTIASPTLNPPIKIVGDPNNNSAPTVKLTGGGNEVNQFQVTNQIATTPTAVDASVWNQTLCHGDNATAIGCSSQFIRVQDDATVTGSNKGVLYGLNVTVWATQDRNNPPFDDADGIVISSPGPGKGTEALYIGRNAGKTYDWGAVIGVDAAAPLGIDFTGNYNFGIDFSTSGTAKSTFTGGVFLIPAPTSGTTAIISAGTDWLTPANDTQLLQVDLNSKLILPNGASTKALAGTGTTTLATGAAAGTSPTIACTASRVCDSLSGTITLTTGTSPTTGTLATITLPAARATAPNCAVNIKGVAGTVYTDTESTTAITLTAVSALTASTAYTVNYVCGGV